MSYYFYYSTAFSFCVFHLLEYLVFFSVVVFYTMHHTWLFVDTGGLTLLLALSVFNYLRLVFMSFTCFHYWSDFFYYSLLPFYLVGCGRRGVPYLYLLSASTNLDYLLC